MCNFFSEGNSFKSQSSGFFESADEVHVVHSLSRGALDEVVQRRVYNKYIAFLLQIEQALVGVDDLFQVDVHIGHNSEGMSLIECLKLFSCLLERQVCGNAGADKNSAGEVPPPGYEVYGLIERCAQLFNRPVDLLQMLVR